MKRRLISLLGVALFIGIIWIYEAIVLPYVTHHPSSALAEVWAPYQLASVTMSVVIVALALGLVLVIIGNDNLHLGAGYILLIYIGSGMLLANGAAWISFPSVPPPCDNLGCPAGHTIYACPLFLFVGAYPILSLALVATSVLAALVGYMLRRATQRGVPAVLTQLLLVMPALAVTAIGLVALFLFPVPVLQA